MKTICDTNVVSQYLERKYPIISYIVDYEIGVENICLTSIISIELNRWLSSYQGIIKEDRISYKRFIRSREVFHINEAISRLGLSISNKWVGLEPTDILIGVTAMYYELPFYTCNVKHFRPMVEFGLDLRPLVLTTNP